MHGFTRHGSPDAGDVLLEGEVLIRDGSPALRTGHVRLYGETVEPAVARAEHPGAASLERLWNQIIQLHRAALFCADEVQPEAGPLPHSVASCTRTSFPS